MEVIMKKLSILVLFVMLFAVILTACGDTHQHTYSDKWTTDSENHWHKATCEHTDAIASKGAHVDTDENGQCDVCGLGDGHNHNYSDEWCNDATNHWHAATCDGHADEKIVVAPHSDEDENGICDVCDYDIYYTVTVNASDVVTVSGDLTTKNSSTVTFTATVSNKYLLTVDGATQSGNAVENNDGTVTCTYTVADVASQDVVVNVYAERFNYATVVATGTAGFETLVSFFNYSEFTVNIPAAGKYYVVCDNPEVGIFGTEEGVIEATEAGEYTVQTSYYSWDEGEGFDFSYTVLEAETEITIDEAGEGYILPSNLLINVTFVAPEAGEYFISSSVTGIAWDDNVSYNGIFVKASKAGEIINFTIKYESAEEATFEFDWTATIPEGTVLEIGDNNLVVAYGNPEKVVFTAPAAGNYAMITANGSWFYYIGDYGFTSNYSSSKSLYLEEGESVIYYIYSAYTEDDYQEVVTVYPAVAYGESTVKANGEGILYVYINDLTDSYSYNSFNISVGEDALIGIQGEDGIEWVSAYDVVELYGEEGFVFYVKTVSGEEADVVVNVAEKVYEQSLVLGDNEITLEPGILYNLYIDAGDTYIDIVVEWDNAEVSVILQNDDYLTSGATAMWYGNDYNWYIMNSTDAAVTLNVSVALPSAGDAPESYDGSFTVEAGTYGSSANAGFYDYVVADDGSVTVYQNGIVATNVMINLGMGGVYSFQASDMRMGMDIGTSLSGSHSIAYGEDMVLYTVTFSAGSGSGSGSGDANPTSLALGENHIKVTVTNYYCAGVEISFTATEAGTYTLAAAAGETNADVFSIDSEDYVDLPYTFTLEAGQSVTFIIATTAFMTLTEDVIDLVITKQ